MLRKMREEVIELLLLKTHQDIIDYIKTKIDVSLYLIIGHEDYTVFVPKNLNQPKPALCCHTDTVFSEPLKRKKIGIKNDILFSKHKSLGLGADDRAGCYVLLKTMQEYAEDFIFCFFDGEESGCIGSIAFNGQAIAPLVKLWVGFDRRGFKDVVCYGNENKELNTLIDSNYFEGYSSAMGSCSDVLTLSDETDIACVNFSTGYQREHSKKETLSLKGLAKVFGVIPKLIELPDSQIKIDIFKAGYLKYGYGYDYGYEDDFDAYNSNSYSKYNNRNWGKNLLNCEEEESYVECSLCYSYFNKNAMVKIYSNENEYVCKECAEYFSEEELELNDKITICDSCGTQFNKEEDLCPYCGVSNLFKEKKDRKLW